MSASRLSPASLYHRRQARNARLERGASVPHTRAEPDPLGESKMFLRNCWYVAAWDHEVTRMTLLRRTLLGEPVVFYRTEDGKPVALEDRCCHRHAPLSRGRLKGDAIECPYHGFTYDPSGACIAVPGQAAIPPGARVRSYPVVERYRWLWIWMGDPALADPDAIEDFHWMDDPAWRAAGERLELKANYVLLIENLLDLSHLSYVHPTTLGTDKVAQTPMKAERLNRGVRVTRWVMDSPPPPFFQKAGNIPADQPVDRWQIIDWTPAAFVRLDVGCAPSGTGARDGDRSRGISMRNLNAITPETERTTHYFWAQAHNFKIDQKWATDLIFQNVHTAFLEDLAIIGAQQENIETAPDRPRIDMNHDAGSIAARRMLETLIAEEARALVAQ
jgi:phenylpropionate dioxygenase-like ring-hydroxylating dioxygenase large terminal subunit